LPSSSGSYVRSSPPSTTITAPSNRITHGQLPPARINGSVPPSAQVGGRFSSTHATLRCGP
jgi:hypothetical protein